MHTQASPRGSRARRIRFLLLAAGLACAAGAAALARAQEPGPREPASALERVERQKP